MDLFIKMAVLLLLMLLSKHLWDGMISVPLPNSDAGDSSAQADAGDSSSYSQYSEEMAEYFVDFAGASYCSGNHDVAQWTCDACKNHENVKATSVTKRTVFLVFNSFVAYDPKKNWITLAISGTDPFKFQDVLTDLQIKKMDYPPCSKAGTSCQVHSGFYKAYTDARTELRSTLQTYLDDYPGAEFHITGHSLGGAFSVIAAVDLMDMVNVSSVYTFGQPRVGDPAYARFFESTRIPLFRVTHYKDAIPHVPLKKMGFQHMSTEVYYEEESRLGTLLNPKGAYKVCDKSGEDPTCMNKHVLPHSWSILMHLVYLQMNFAKHVMHCKAANAVDKAHNMREKLGGLVKGAGDRLGRHFHHLL